MFETINKKQLTQVTIKRCDTCGEHIIEYGHSWIEVEKHIGSWKYNPEEITTFHFCSNECMDTWLKGGDFLDR